MIPLTLDEIEAAARDKLPRHIYDFYASGSDNQRALARNRNAFSRCKPITPCAVKLTDILCCSRLYIRPRVLKDVSNVDTSAELFGSRSSLPIGIAPSAMQRLAGGDGELDIARAAAGMHLNLTLSSQSTTALEDVIQVQKEAEPVSGSAPPFWMQLYLYEDMQKSVALIKRAEGINQLP